MTSFSLTDMHTFVAQDSVCSGPNESLALIKPTFVRIYMSLVDILLKKVQYPSEVQLNSWSNGMLQF